MSPAILKSAVLSLFVSFAFLVGCQSSPVAAQADPAAMPPPEVEVTPVVQEPVEVFSEWVATIDGSVNAQIQPQVTGYVVKQNYTEGAFVRKGDVLFEIDARPFQAIVDQAKGQLAQAEGMLAQAQSQVRQAESAEAQAQAQWKKAEIDVNRDTPLAKARAIPQSQLDSETQALAAAAAAVKAAQANIVTSQASVKSAEAGIVAAKASVAQAELNVNFTQVRSLVDGIAGVAQTQIGNLVKTDTVLTTVSQVDPIRVYFPISEREYLGLSLNKGKAGGNLLSAKSSLELLLTDGSTYAHKGHIIFVDREVDSKTGTIRVAAAFANPGNVLRPGQFGRVRALTAQKKDALLIPQRAVTELQGKFQVAVVGPDSKVQIRVIQLGPTQGSRYVVEKGLAAGESVVVEGLARAMPGAPVSPKPAAVPAADTKKAE